MKCTVELRGMTNDLAALRSIEVDVKEGATLQDLVRALRAAEPALEGRVITPGADRLAGWYGFTVNGRYHVDDYETRIEEGDHVMLLAWSLGG